MRALFVFFYSLLFSLLFAACGSNAPVSEGEVVAEYEGRKFTTADLKRRAPAGLPSSDSAAAAQRAILEWKSEIALEKVAKERIPDWQNRVRPQVEDYERKLLIFALEDEAVKSALDTVVTPAQIEEYYKKNINRFISPSPLYAYYYIKTQDQNTPELRQRLPSKKQEDREKIETWAKGNAISAKLDDVYLDAAGIRQIQQEGNVNGLIDVQPNTPVRVFTTQENGKETLHFFFMRDVIKPGKYIPMANLTEPISEAILASRKNKIIQDFRTKTLQDAGLDLK